MKTILQNETFKRAVSGIILGFCFFGAYTHSSMLFTFILLAISLIILFFEWPLLINLKNKKNWIITLLYPVLPLLILIYLNYIYYTSDFYLPLYPFIAAWVGDTGGYLIGKPFGKHKICPSISPKKTWEGFAGGFAATLIFNFIFLPTINVYPITYIMQNMWLFTILSFCIYIVGFSGDLFISVLKRLNNLKDTGSLLPGHGGLLDRFDSVLFVSIFTGILLIVSWII